MSFLVVNGLEKRFGPVEVLKGIDISVPQGGFLVLVGPSGCGKSTLLNSIAGLETVSAGEILIDGVRVNELHPSKRDIAMVFPVLRALPQHERRQEHVFRHGDAERAQGRAQADRGQGGQHAANRGPSRPQAGPALGRSAATRRHGPGARARPQDIPVRRAALQPRRQAPRRDAHGDSEATPAAGDDHRLRDPRPDRGDDAGHRDRGAEGRNPAAGRQSGRHLQHARQYLRGGLHGLTVDEPGAGAPRPGQRGVGRQPESAPTARRRCFPSTGRPTPRALTWTAT